MDEFIFSNEFYKNIDLTVHTCGMEVCKPGHYYGWAVRSSWMVHFILSGKGIYKCEDRTFHLKAGDLFLIIPGQRIFYQADEEDPWTYKWIGLQGIKAEEYMRRTSLPDTLVASMKDHPDLMKAVDSIETIRYRPNSDLLLSSMAYKVMYALAEAFPHHHHHKTIDAEEYIELILSYVEQHFDEPISVNEISDHFALDRTYIHRLIKKATGSSLQDYIISLRLANACSYLAFTSLSVSDIAHSVGYKDSLAFSKLFKKRKGRSPLAYRQEKKRLPQESAS